MALNFDVLNVKDFKTVCSHPIEKGKWHPVTNALIWKTLQVDLGDINDRNVDEWWYRVRLLQLLEGPELQFNEGPPAYLTYRDIKMHVGLRTNVTTRARTYWLKRMFNPSQKLAALSQTKTAYELVNERGERLKKEMAGSGS